ncbi:MAG: SDR family NAD(P)-dependent oxidoreductase, partial [Clostridia bacterium]
MNNNKVALVTGGSSGIGRAISSALFKNGFTVYELSRRDIPCEGVTHITADVTNESAITSAISLILKKSQKIDLLV